MVFFLINVSSFIFLLYLCNQLILKTTLWNNYCIMCGSTSCSL